MKVLAIRHGEPNYVNADKILQEIERTEVTNFPDPKLTPKGKTQIKSLAENLKKYNITAIYCSPAKRARESAEIIAEKLGIKITIEPLINNITFETKIIKEIIIKRLEGKTNWQDEWLNNNPGFSESPAEYQQRVKKMIQKTRQLHPNDTILLVAHEETVWSFLAQTKGIPFSEAVKTKVDYASLTELEF
ncbi:MAG: histidine phosphatase family protein [bacterium]